jgi:hypothetical protein
MCCCDRLYQVVRHDVNTFNSWESCKYAMGKTHSVSTLRNSRRQKSQPCADITLTVVSDISWLLFFKDPDNTYRTQYYHELPPQDLHTAIKSVSWHTHEGVLLCCTITIPMCPTLLRTHCTACAGKFWDHPQYSLDLSLCSVHSEKYWQFRDSGWMKMSKAVVVQLL